MPEALKTHFRRQRFAREYLLDLNGTRAAIAAGYSAKTAAAAASRLLDFKRVLRRPSEPALGSTSRLSA
jgi:phage terminase small subunit